MSPGPNLRLAAFALVVAVCAPAQEPVPVAEPVDVAALVRQIRVGEPTHEELQEIADAVLGTTEAGAKSLFNAIRSELSKRSKALAKDHLRLLRDFGRAAPVVLARRLGRDGPKRVEVLRDEVLERSRSGDLAKATIHDEIDPRIAELRQLLVLTPDDVLDAVPKLGEEVVRLRAEIVTLEVLFEIQERAELQLLRTDTGRRHIEHYPLADDPRGHREELDQALARLAWLATPMSPRDARALTGNDELTEGVEPEEKAGTRALNELRVLLALPVVAIDVKLCAAARGHSQDMARLGFFSHTSPVAGKESFGQRAALAGTSASAENIARGQRTGPDAIRAWWYSPGHHRNMMSGASRVGLGQHGDHWTQMFGG